MNVFSIPPGSEVLVYHEKPKEWKVPYIHHSYDNFKTATVKINIVIEPFSIISIKPYNKETEDQTQTTEDQPEEASSSNQQLSLSRKTKHQLLPLQLEIASQDTGQ